jgi:hypothetical protein
VFGEGEIGEGGCEKPFLCFLNRSERSSEGSAKHVNEPKKTGAQCAQCTAAGAIKSSSNNIFTCIFPCVYSYTRTGCIQSIYTSNDPILIFQDGAEENLSCLKIYKRHTHLEINKHWNKCGKKLAGCTF